MSTTLCTKMFCKNIIPIFSKDKISAIAHLTLIPISENKILALKQAVKDSSNESTKIKKGRLYRSTAVLSQDPVLMISGSEYLSQYSSSLTQFLGITSF